MITQAPDWLQPLLWIACIALAACVLVLVWSKLASRLERLHVESMSEPASHWKNYVLSAAFALLALFVAILVSQI